MHYIDEGGSFNDASRDGPPQLEQHAHGIEAPDWQYIRFYAMTKLDRPVQTQKGMWGYKIMRGNDRESVHDGTWNDCIGPDAWVEVQGKAASRIASSNPEPRLNQLAQSTDARLQQLQLEARHHSCVNEELHNFNASTWSFGSVYPAQFY